MINYKKHKQPNLSYRLITLLIFILSSQITFSINQQITNPDSLEQVLRSIKDISNDAISIKIKLANYYSDINLPKSMKFSIELEKQKKLLSEGQKGRLYLQLGKNYFQLSNHSLAIDNFMQALDLAKITKNLDLEADASNNLGVLYTSLGQTEKSIEYVNDALKLSETNNDKKRAVTLSSNLSLMYVAAGNFEKAYEYINKAIEINSTYVKNKENEVSNLNTLSLIHIYNGNKSEALLTCKKAIKRANENKTSNLNLQASSQAIICEIYSELGEYSEIITHGKELIKLAEKLNSNLKLKLAYEYLAKAHEGMGNNKKSYDYYKLFSTYKDSVLTEDKFRHIKEIEVKYDIEQFELENAILINENKIYQQKQKIESQKQMVLAIGLGFLLIFIVGLLYFFKNREKKHVLEQELIQTELKYAEQEITDLALHLIQKGNAYDFIKKELKSINKKEVIPEGKKIIQNLIQDINLNLGLDQDRIILKEKVEKQENKFVNNMKDKYPVLTKKDIDLALLIRLDFTSKEIASIFKISHQSVNTSRYRLRKKMELSKADDLIEIIQKI